jgi:hypothetical protein
MKREPLGCLTVSGVIAGILTLLLVAGVSLARGGVLFSPGALNAQAGQALGGVPSHAMTGGECRRCHAPFWSADRMSDRCLECHALVANQLADPQSLHGILFASHPEQECRSCHPDHRGPEAPLTNLKKVIFPHERLGFSLAGHPRNTNGSPFQCEDCHKQGYSRFDQSVCQECHIGIDMQFVTAHLLKFGSDCLACHDGLDTYGKNFDHNLFPFALTGRHETAACSACHQNARNRADLENAPQDCFSCHGSKDAHQGRYGTDCQTCHTPQGWSPAQFDHNLSIFKLVGLHFGVPCEDCHQNNVFLGTPISCNSCHAAEDKHAGSYGTDCSLCHTPAGWLPSTFNHNLFAFKLEGRHANVLCTDCHANGQFQNMPTDCYSCHAQNDVHAGGFGRECSACHTSAGWLPAFFDHSSFPLTNGHAGLPCTRCHTVAGDFSGLSPACSTCHADPAFHAGMFGANCAECHSTANWFAVYIGPHPATCEGQCIGHEGASCRDCHTSTLAEATCTVCHSSNNPHD